MKKLLLFFEFLAVFYILRKDGAHVRFQGLTQNQITSMLAEQHIDFRFIKEGEYNAAMNAQAEKLKAEFKGTPRGPSMKDLQDRLDKLEAELAKFKGAAPK